ncbi:Nuclear pore glycoprotein p62 [Tritrichomonas foetus]|uniref:Nuclear pore glycoprotein p62 n=1 Tax=Tritrichomonas foetus TaxID=1144522 RepID=A0A1J4KZK0_9EUKA|nr:Nuclear pore glycoprotein p62 [Tritrichomonas foetus]|eukprot:OHT15116.1 Nuclear pore glycoprotein p62 [Tritrichomonas foetus]
MNTNFLSGFTSNQNQNKPNTAATGTAGQTGQTGQAGAQKGAFGQSNTFSFGITAPTTTGPKDPPPIPDEIKNKTVKNVIDTMENQLEQQSRAFQSQARQIARWDRMLFESIELIQQVEEQIKKAEAAQKELQQSAMSLLQDQDQFIQNMKEKTASPIPQSADQRQKLYRLAHHLGDKFLDMETQLKELVDIVDSQNQAESSSDIDKITQITNCHLNSMQWMVNQCEGLDEKMNDITRKLPESLL